MCGIIITYGFGEKNMKREIAVVIPAYEPNESLLQVLDGITATLKGCSVILVDDGSRGSQEIFERAEEYDNLTLLKHPTNAGKGAALKTAFYHILSQSGEKVIVTADADGQHKPEDILKVAQTYMQTGCGLVLGSRKFEGKIPFKSTFGNVVARGLLRLCDHRRLHDTQTGLRAFGSELLPFMLSVGGTKYEYEMNVLVRCLRCGIPIKETAIATVYIDNNQATHFKPVRDFCRICGVVIQYSLPFVFALICNLALFFILQNCVTDFSLDACSYAALCCGLSCAAATVLCLLLEITASALYRGINRRTFLKRIIKIVLTALIISVIDCGTLSGLLISTANPVLSKILADLFTVTAFCITSYATAENKPLYE